MTFDWKKTAWKAAKTGLVAAGAALLLEPSLTPGILAIVPAEFRAVAAISLPALITAARNWLKHSQGGF